MMVMKDKVGLDKIVIGRHTILQVSRLRRYSYHGSSTVSMPSMNDCLVQTMINDIYISCGKAKLHPRYFVLTTN